MKSPALIQIFKRHNITFLVLPALFSVFPILSFYQNNISELSLKFLEKPLLYSIIGSIILSSIIYLFLKNKNKTTIVSSVLVFVFFSYGHLSKYLNDKLFIQTPGGIVLGPDKILLPILFLILVLLFIKIVNSKVSFNKLVSYLLFIFTVLVILNSITIIYKENQRVTIDPKTSSNMQQKITTNKDTPDIYYIILDGYARQDVLKEIYNYDNSEFIETLRKMGFYVADSSRSNYIHTYLSLPSTLNMRYLDDLPQKYGKKPIDESAAINLVYNNLISSILKSYGYTTINFSTWWSGTNEGYPANINYNYEKNYKVAGISLLTNETNMVFLQTTLLSPLIKEVWGDVLRGKILVVFEKLPDVPYLNDKKFVIAHITAPHPPYIFSSDGGSVQGSEFENADEGIEKRPKYIEQLVFVNNNIIPVIEKIIKNSKNPPIIILQSDHGPASIFGKREDWMQNYNQEAVKERSSILYAVFLPDKKYDNFYEIITPVNTFRIIFNKYFGENLELLPDKTYFSNYEAMYNFIDVTNSSP